MAYNVLAVVLAALRSIHGEETVAHEVSLYSIANEIAMTYNGMMIAIPEPEWAVFYAMRTADLAAILLDLAQRVRLKAFRKSPKSPRNPVANVQEHPRRAMYLRLNYSCIERYRWPHFNTTEAYTYTYTPTLTNYKL